MVMRPRSVTKKLLFWDTGNNNQNPNYRAPCWPFARLRPSAKTNFTVSWKCSTRVSPEAKGSDTRRRCGRRKWPYKLSNWCSFNHLSFCGQKLTLEYQNYNVSNQLSLSLDCNRPWLCQVMKVNAKNRRTDEQIKDIVLYASKYHVFICKKNSSKYY